MFSGSESFIELYAQEQKVIDRLMGFQIWAIEDPVLIHGERGGGVAGERQRWTIAAPSVGCVWKRLWRGMSTNF